MLWSLALLVVSFVAAIADDHTSNTPPNTYEAEFSLKWPLGCTVFEECFIQHYPDLRAGTNPALPVDYKCGMRTAPNLKGTTIIFKDRNTTQTHQPVLAAHAGRVLFLENTIPDGHQYSEQSEYACGNYVVVRHSAQYRTKYCNLRQGSVVVNVGQKVDEGEKLAEVGNSGATEQPQLYFEVQKNETPVDPFTSRVLSTPSECFSLADQSLWQEELPYLPAGVIAASFTPVRPTPMDLEFKTETFTALPPTVGVLSAWIKLFGITKGDIETLTIKTPSGRVWHKTERLHPVDANFWTAIVSASPSAPLEEGGWTALYTLQREGEVVFEKEFSVSIMH